MDNDMKQSITLSPIGHVCSSVRARTDTGWGDVTARIELKTEYAGALTGLEGFSHALIVTYLHQAHFDPNKHLMRRPQGRDDMPQVGILSQRAKNRPNPIGVTAVEVLKVGDTSLDVKGLDAIDSTPVLDVKPYFPMYDRVEVPCVPAWVEELMKDYF
jgi:tRNA-Thr(GGU) m(6)t(6)A37 methyltransferase TsaA